MKNIVLGISIAGIVIGLIMIFVAFNLRELKAEIAFLGILIAIVSLVFTFIVKVIISQRS